MSNRYKRRRKRTSSVKHYPLPPFKCASCGLVSDSASGVDTLSPGAYLICFGCGQVVQVNLDWTMTQLSDDEVATIPELRRWQTELREHIRGKS